MEVIIRLLLVLTSLNTVIEARGRGGGRGGRSRTGSRHSASNLRFSAVGINRNPVRLIAILPFGSAEINSYPAREGYFPCPQSGGSLNLTSESDNNAIENINSGDLQEPKDKIGHDLLTSNQFVYICFNETKPQDDPVDVFDTTVAVVVILLIFGLIFDLTRRAAFQGPTTTFASSSAFADQASRSRSLPDIDEDHILRIQRMARTGRRATVATAILRQDSSILPPSVSPTISMSRKSSEDKPPSYTEVVNPPPSYEETMRAVSVKMNQNAQRLLKK